MTPSATRPDHSLGDPPAATARRASVSLRRRFVILLLLLGVLVTVAAPGAVPAAASSGSWAASSVSSSSSRWTWPVSGTRTVVAPFRAPAHAFGAGHRGIDILAAAGGPVVAPADGVVAFRGTVVDRPLLTIEHEGGFVSTLEPVDSALRPGDAIRAGMVVGALGHGGHSPAGALHLGVRREGAYVDPMLLFGGAPRAVLLPCCAPL